MSEPPTPLPIPELLVDGFAAESASPGQTVKILVSGRFTSDQPVFHIYAIQITRSLTHNLRIFLPDIDRLLVLIHDDNSAEVYINNFDVLAEARATRNVKAGEPLRAPDLSDIRLVVFSNITVRSTDKIIYIGRHEWRFGLYFNFTRNIGNEK
jgi:hypothetical protein